MEDTIYRIAIGAPGFLLAIVCHEAAHAYVAYKFGDDTAKYSGRLTLNPMVHYDMIGTLIFPLIGALMGGMMFGWAKPVPVDPRRFKNVRAGTFWVSFAGPLANIIMAVSAAFLFALVMTQFSPTFYFYDVFGQMLRQAIIINIVLAVFNLLPFPPLDGSKMVSSFLDYESARRYESLQAYSLLFIIVLWMTPIFSYLVTPAIYAGNNIVNFFLRLLA